MTEEATKDKGVTMTEEMKDLVRRILNLHGIKEVATIGAMKVLVADRIIGMLTLLKRTHTTLKTVEVVVAGVNLPKTTKQRNQARTASVVVVATTMVDGAMNPKTTPKMEDGTINDNSFSDDLPSTYYFILKLNIPIYKYLFTI